MSSSVQDRDAAHLMGHTDLKTSLQYLTEKYLNVILNKGFKSLNGLRVDPAIRCGISTRIKSIMQLVIVTTHVKYLYISMSYTENKPKMLFLF